MSLSEQDRETLLNALWDDGCHGFGSDHTHWPIAVEAVIERHVRVALTEAAERIEARRADGRPLLVIEAGENSGLDIAARIVRNLADSTSSPLTSP